MNEQDINLLACNLQTAWRAWLRGCNIDTEHRLRKVKEADIEFKALADVMASTHRANSKATISTATSILKGSANANQDDQEQ